jgi:hypothetical protein
VISNQSKKPSSQFDDNGVNLCHGFPSSLMGVKKVLNKATVWGQPKVSALRLASSRGNCKA